MSVFKPVPSLAAVLILVAGLAGLASTAEARQYWIDDVLAACGAQAVSNRSSAVAYSPTGVFGCTWNHSTNEEAQGKALERCNRDLPQTARAHATTRCKLISVNGKVVDTATVRRLRRDIRIPASFEIFDKSSGKVQKFNGAVVLGRLASNLQREVRMITNQGLEICNGTYGHRKDSIEFAVICLNKFRSQKLLITPASYTLSDGVYKPDFQTIFKQKGSYIQVTTRNR